MENIVSRMVDFPAHAGITFQKNGGFTFAPNDAALGCEFVDRFDFTQKLDDGRVDHVAVRVFRHALVAEPAAPSAEVLVPSDQ